MMKLWKKSENRKTTPDFLLATTEATNKSEWVSIDFSQNRNTTKEFNTWTRMRTDIWRISKKEFFLCTSSRANTQKKAFTKQDTDQNRNLKMEKDREVKLGIGREECWRKKVNVLFLKNWPFWSGRKYRALVRKIISCCHIIV